MMPSPIRPPVCSASGRRAATIAAAAAVAAATGATVLVGAARLPLEALYVDGVFWFLLASFALLGTTAVAPLRAASRAELLRLSVVVAAAGAVTAISFAVVVPRYRILADETNLVSTSLSLFVDRSLHNITAVLHTADGQLQILTQGVATRPALFPFLLAILHLVFGYHAWFAFAVNFALEAATLTLLVLLGRELAGIGYGILAALLLAAFPLYALVATSAGFDAAQLFGLVALLLCAVRFVRRPTGLGIERMLILTAIASQCRYESPLLVLPLGVLAASRARLLWREGHFSLRLVVAPLLFLPPLLHATVIGAQAPNTASPSCAAKRSSRSVTSRETSVTRSISSSTCTVATIPWPARQRSWRSWAPS